MVGKTVDEFMREQVKKEAEKLKKEYERLQKERELPETAKVILKTIENQLVAQNKKGLKEYGKTIDDADDNEYDWNFEALAECVDALQYAIKENAKLKKAFEITNKSYSNLLGDYSKLKNELLVLRKTNDSLTIQNVNLKNDYTALGKLYQLQAERIAELEKEVVKKREKLFVIPNLYATGFDAKDIGEQIKRTLEEIAEKGVSIDKKI